MNDRPDRDRACEHSIVFLQEQLAFQQRALDQLNQVILEQQTKLERLGREVAHLTETMRTIIERNSESLPDERPPHY